MREDVVPFVDEDRTINYFSVPWKKDELTFKQIYPSPENNCGDNVCETTVHDTW